MRVTLLFTLLSFFILFDFSQTDEDSINAYSYGIVEIKPEFPGGCQAFYNYIDNSLSYPVRAKDKNICGDIYVEFVIDESGKVSHARVANHSNPYLGFMALKVIKSMPDWTPGKHNGKNVSVVNIIPIKFILASDLNPQIN